MYYVYCSLILTLQHELQWNCYTVEFIYTIVPQAYTICGGIYIYIYIYIYFILWNIYFFAVGAGESEVSPIMLYTNAVLSDITCKMKWKWHPKFSEDSRFPSEIQWYKNTSTVFRFWNVQSSTKRSPHPPIIQISIGGIYFNDILMGHFVMSQIQENNFAVQTSRSL